MNLLLLAASSDSEADKAAPLGLFVILALAVAVFFLARSMIKHIRKVPPSFDGRDHGGNLSKLGESGAPKVYAADAEAAAKAAEAEGDRLRLPPTPPRLGTPDQFYGPDGRLQSKKPNKKNPDAATAGKRSPGSKTQQKAKIRDRKQQLKARKAKGRSSSAKP